MVTSLWSHSATCFSYLWKQPAMQGGMAGGEIGFKEVIEGVAYNQLASFYIVSNNGQLWLFLPLRPCQLHIWPCVPPFLLLTQWRLWVSSSVHGHLFFSLFFFLILFSILWEHPCLLPLKLQQACSGCLSAWHQEYSFKNTVVNSQAVTSWAKQTWLLSMPSNRAPGLSAKAAFLYRWDWRQI